MGKTFSENWFRVAHLRVGLRPTLFVRQHVLRGDVWFVLHERINNNFHLVSPPTWRFLSRISVDFTVDELWRTAIEEDPRNTPGQEDVFQLLMKLHHSNLLFIEGSVDELRLLERAEAKKRKPALARLTEVMFLRVPLVDPEPWLRRAEPWIHRILSRSGALLAALLVVLGGIELIQAGDRAWHQAENLLQWHNALLLYAAILCAKGLHELGHAAMCKRFGGEVRSAGVMLLMFTPLPYVDVSSSWALRDGRKRAMIGAAGMMVDCVVGAIATLIWAHAPPGAVNELAYNLMFSAAIYTVVFNINPLMRFDGYYILSDLIGMPNLHDQSKEAFQRWFGRWVLDTRHFEEEPYRVPVSFGLVAFYLASNAYRLLVMGGVVLFVADAYFGLGLVVAIALVLTTFVLPLQQHLRTLRNPLFRFQQKRLLDRGVVVAVGLALFILLVPVPDSRVLSGVMEAAAITPVFLEAAGKVTQVHGVSGDWVAAGVPLVDLENPELDAEIRGIEAQIAHAELLAAKAVDEGAVDLAPLEERLRTLRTVKATFHRQRASLQIRAPQDGYWVAPEMAYQVNNWMARGAELGRVVDDRTLVFRGVIRQEAAAVLLHARRDGVEVRLEGERERVFTITELTLVPHSRDTLPSAALGPAAGGEIPVTAANSSGLQTAEPYFLLQARLPPVSAKSEDSGTRNGRTGWIRVKMPWRPLAGQVWTGVRQFFQRRYRV